MLVKTTGDGLLLEFPSVVAAVECAIAIQKLMVGRNAETLETKRIVYRIGVNLGDVLIEGDDILGDGVNIAARLEGICEPGGVLDLRRSLRQCARQDRRGFCRSRREGLEEHRAPGARIRAWGRRDRSGERSTPPSPAAPLKPMAPALLGTAALLILIAAGGWYWFIANRPAAVATGPPATVATNVAAPAEARHLSIVVLPFTNLSGNSSAGLFRRWDHRKPDDRPVAHPQQLRHRSQHSFYLPGQEPSMRRRSARSSACATCLKARRNATRTGCGSTPSSSTQKSGAHLWADRFDEDIADLFKLQDEVVARLANTLGVELVKAEAEKGAGSKNPTPSIQDAWLVAKRQRARRSAAPH